MKSNRDGTPRAESSPSTPKSRPVNKQMSFEQLQAKLTEKVQSRGHINEVKAELRNKLVNDLFDMSSQLNLSRRVLHNSETSKLPLQVSHWLVCDFLRREGYEFTMSTFLRESHLVTSPELTFTIDDILHILAVPKNSNMRKDLIQMYNNGEERCLVYHILERLLKEVPSDISKSNAETNTNPVSMDDTRVFNQKEEYFRKRIDAEIRNRLNLVLAKQKVPEKETDDRDYDENDYDNIESNNIAENDRKIANNEKEKDYKPKAESEAIPTNFDKETYLSKLKMAENEVRITTLTEQNRILQNQINSLSQIIGSQSDYNIIKSELEMVKQELATTTKYFQDARSKQLELKNSFEAKILELTMGMVTPSTELLKAHQELKKVESTFRQDQEALNHQNIRLSCEVKDLKQNYEKAVNRINDLKYHVSSLNQIIERLQSEIQSARWLQDEKERQHFRSKSHPNNVEYQPGPQYSNAPFHYASNTNPVSRRPENQSSYSSSGSSSLLKPPSFIQEAKNRLDVMEAEARNLERTYGRVLENQLRVPTISSCYPYQLDAQLKMAKSVPSLNQDDTQIYQQKRQRYASTQGLSNNQSQQSDRNNQEVNYEHHYASMQDLRLDEIQRNNKSTREEFPVRYASSYKRQEPPQRSVRPNTNLIHDDQRRKAHHASSSLFSDEPQRNIKSVQDKTLKNQREEFAVRYKSSRKPEDKPEQIVRHNGSSQDFTQVGLQQKVHGEEFPVRYASSPEQEDTQPERPNFMSESGDEIMFLIQTKTQETQEMGSYNVKYNDKERNFCMQRSIEEPRATVLSIPNPAEKAEMHEKSPNNLQDVSMPSFRMMNSISELPEQSLINKENLKGTNPHKAEDKQRNSEPNPSKPESALKPSQSLNFEPLNYSTPLSKVSESKLQQKDLSTLYENEDQEDVISEKSVSLGNQKEDNSNSDEFW